MCELWYQALSLHYIAYDFINGRSFRRIPNKADIRDYIPTNICN